MHSTGVSNARIVFSYKRTQRDFLIGTTTIPSFRLEACAQCPRVGLGGVTGAVLIERKLVAFDKSPPKFTVLTEKGREVASLALGNMADDLVRAQLLEPRPIIDLPKYRRIDKLAEALEHAT